MATYPTDFPSIRGALVTYEPHGTTASAIEAAQATASPVVQVVKVFDALKSKIGVIESPPVPEPEEGEEPEEPGAPTVVLDESGLKLLAGCAHMISEHGFHNKGSEAVPVLLAAVSALDALAA